jgi:hypothetical protein
MSSPEARARLAAQQADLVRGLLGRDAPPADFDIGRLQAAARALASKRMRAAAQAWPALAKTLGNAFAQRFADYAANTTIPRCGGPLADGRAFARFLAATGDLPDSGRAEAFWVDLQFYEYEGLKPRRGPAFAVALLRDSRRLLLGARSPGFGVRRLSVPIGFLATLFSANSRTPPRQEIRKTPFHG